MNYNKSTDLNQLSTFNKDNELKKNFTFKLIITKFNTINNDTDTTNKIYALVNNLSDDELDEAISMLTDGNKKSEIFDTPIVPQPLSNPKTINDNQFLTSLRNLLETFFKYGTSNGRISTINSKSYFPMSNQIQSDLKNFIANVCRIYTEQTSVMGAINNNSKDKTGYTEKHITTLRILDKQLPTENITEHYKNPLGRNAITLKSNLKKKDTDTNKKHVTFDKKFNSGVPDKRPLTYGGKSEYEIQFISKKDFRKTHKDDGVDVIFHDHSKGKFYWYCSTKKAIYDLRFKNSMDKNNKYTFMEKISTKITHFDLFSNLEIIYNDGTQENNTDHLNKLDTKIDINEFFMMLQKQLMNAFNGLSDEEEGKLVDSIVKVHNQETDLSALTIFNKKLCVLLHPKITKKNKENIASQLTKINSTTFTALIKQILK